MSFSTPGPLQHVDRCARYKAREEDQHPDPSSAGARGVAAVEKPATESEVLGFGMKLFLASLTMIFGATFVAYGIIWWRNRGDWQGAVDSGEIIGLAGATVLLVAADVATARAEKRGDDKKAARKLTGIAAALATLYLVVQSISWIPLLAQADPDGTGSLRMEGFLFIMITFAHAAHVLGGIVASGIVYARSADGSGPTPGALQMLAQYWRFLTVMWVFVLGLLLAM